MVVNGIAYEVNIFVMGFEWEATHFINEAFCPFTFNQVHPAHSMLGDAALSLVSLLSVGVGV